AGRLPRPRRRDPPRLPARLYRRPARLPRPSRRLTVEPRGGADAIRYPVPPMLDPALDLHDAVIVGAGLAGLACAHDLAQRGLSVVLLEAADTPGGRARTDAVDGFLLERGAQFLLTGAPELRSHLDLAALDLRPLAPGAIVHANGAMRRISDPRRSPRTIDPALASSDDAAAI